MNPERARGSRRPDDDIGTGQLVPFPEQRAFGPLSWRTVRMASVVILLLLLGGAILELFLWRLEPRITTPGAAQAPS